MTFQHRILDIWLNPIGGPVLISWIPRSHYPPNIELTSWTPSADITITENVCMYMRWITHRIFNEHMNGSGGLPTQYSFNVYKGQADCWPNIHSVHVGVRQISNIHSPYTWVRRIADPIFIWWIQGSGRLLTKYSLSVCRGQADFKYSFTVCMGQADCRPNIHWVYVGVRWITDQIFIHHKQGSGGSLIEYSLSVCRGQADRWLDIHSPYAGVRRIADWIFIHRKQGSGGLLTEYWFNVCRGQADFKYSFTGQADHRMNIQWVYVGVRRIADRIFIHRLQGSGRSLNEYSVSGM